MLETIYIYIYIYIYRRPFKVTKMVCILKIRKVNNCSSQICTKGVCEGSSYVKILKWNQGGPTAVSDPGGKKKGPLREGRQDKNLAFSCRVTWACLKGQFVHVQRQVMTLPRKTQIYATLPSTEHRAPSPGPPVGCAGSLSLLPIMSVKVKFAL